MSQYIGIDLHKAKSFVTRLDRRGRVLVQHQLAHASGELQQHSERLPAETRVEVEATGNWMWLYELIEARHPDLVLTHPLKRKAIASGRIKADKIDATTLAQLLRADETVGRPRHYISVLDCSFSHASNASWSRRLWCGWSPGIVE
ncbi:MAG: IS110 family transposase [Nitrospiraceae bacterium]